MNPLHCFDITTEGKETKMLSMNIKKHFRNLLKYADDFNVNETAREDKSIIARLVIKLNSVSIAFILVLFADFR
jgi:hypothetical protein